MTFGDALEHIKKGGRSTRPGWNGRHMWIYLHQPAGMPAFVALHAADGTHWPWNASQPDMLAEDWQNLR